ncbi:MAG: CPBP family intramembrane metalloprotease [Cyanobacteria bacterium SID2]|nr:CPBP family intramembrane metalloprotease [Cyanobacteria bacterium SID2]
MLHALFDRWATALAWVKIAVFFAVWLGLWFPIAAPLAWRWKWYPFQALMSQQKLVLVGTLYLEFPILIYVAAKIENVSFSHYGWTNPIDGMKSLSIGLVLGLLGVAIQTALELTCGWISWELKPISIERFRTVVSALSLGAILGLWVGGTEELLFRGFLQTQLQSALSVWGAATVSSAIFAVLHLIWGARETFPQIPGLWVMGMVLTLARLVDDGTLSLAWGLHAGWVWGTIFFDSTNATKPTQIAPEWVTGVGGRSLAGLLGVSLLVLTGWIIGQW